jgi:membrane-bound lytic murein transglycosylase MltF
MTRLSGRPLASLFPSWEKHVARIRFECVKENQSPSLPPAVGACQPTNHVSFGLKPFILAVILLLGGLVGFPAPLKSDLKGPPTYSKQEIRRAVTVYAKRYRLDPALLRAVIKVESNFRQDAISRRGAVGLMQLMPPTAARLQVTNIHDPLQNIQGGAKHLRHLLNFYHGNLPLALAAYNAGVHRVKRDVPRIRETKVYIQNVLAYYHTYHRHHEVSLEQNKKKRTEGHQTHPSRRSFTALT